MKRLFLSALLFFAMPAWAAEANLDGTLHGKDGALLADTAIKIQDGQGRILKSAQIDKQGQYHFTGIHDGSYMLLAVQNDTVLASTHFSVSGADDLHKDLNMAEPQGMNIVISPSREEMRNSLSPTTGTNAYKLDQQAIANLPQGEDTPLDKILLQAPGVAEDSAASGSLHIRGEHANLQYRLNGILLPDGISGFGDTIDSHIIENATLLDGALPAQYGFRTAGVVDIDTKTGFQNGGTASMMAGGYGMIQPSVSYGGTYGNTDYFASASHLSSDLGIENPTGAAQAIHDHTEQNKQFAYISYMIDPMERLQLAAGNSISYFQIPNNPNQPSAGYQVNGVNSFDSSTLNERQFESNQYATAAWQGGNNDGVTVQIAPYIRNSEVHYRPDTVGDLLFNGVASDVQDTDLATGIQNDNSWRVNGTHTLRAGFQVQNDHVEDNSNSLAFVTNAAGVPIVDPATGNNVLTSPIAGDHTKDGQLYGLYLQDEWKLARNLTMNYGARFDDMEQYVSANQLSPRIGFVYKPWTTTTFHAGYARYFTPPPMELVSNADIGGFANTTNAAGVVQNDAVKPERCHNFDAGMTQKLDEHWQVSLDGYYKLVHDLLDEGQFGQALILTPFNYDRGHIYGTELTANYTGEKVTAYGNLSASRAMGEDVVSAQFNFDPAELTYINNHFVHLDHDQTLSASSGGTYEVVDGTTLGLDSIFGSGLRKGFANTSSLPPYVTFNASLEQKLNLFPHDQSALRFSMINLLDSVYELRDGSGIGVGAPQWGERRAGFITLVQKF